jgi:hypothetical protein
MHYSDPSLYPSRSGNELLLSLSLSFSFLTGNLEHLVMGYYFGKKNEKKKDSGTSVTGTHLERFSIFLFC